MKRDVGTQPLRNRAWWPWSAPRQVIGESVENPLEFSQIGREDNVQSSSGHRRRCVSVHYRQHSKKTASLSVNRPGERLVKAIGKLNADNN